MDQFGFGNSGAMNMYGGGPDCGYVVDPYSPCAPVMPPVVPVYPAAQAYGGPYGGTMQWDRGNLGGFNVANPGGGSDNIYGGANAGSGNMPGSNRVRGYNRPPCYGPEW